MKNRNKIIRKQGKQSGKMFISVILAAMVLCMGCNGEKQAADNSGLESVTETAGITGQTSGTVQGAAVGTTELDESEGIEADETETGESENESDLEEVAGLEDEEDMELITLYNNSVYQSVYEFAGNLYDAGYDQMCLIGDGGSGKACYFSVINGNHYTLPTLQEAYLYLPYKPTEFSCDIDNIAMHYDRNEDIEYDEESDITRRKNTDICFYNGEFFVDTPHLDSMVGDAREWYKFQENTIELDCVAFEGDDIPVKFSVTFEDGSTQEIMVYLTRHGELYDPWLPYAMTEN